MSKYEDFNEVVSAINSCENLDQLEMCNNLIKSMFMEKTLNIKSIRASGKSINASLDIIREKKEIDAELRLKRIELTVGITGANQ